ncbi:interleukin-9 receptor [Marmota monax]|uniref:interleukin-9 receptor n=1 Tax=Marmota monax TaxID=9995 RepID=UPI001EB029A5|nr:interleukin-9 receptor [Marmota monax]
MGTIVVCVVMLQLDRSLAGWTLESEALIRDLGTWLLFCTCACWGVSVPEEGGGTWAGTFTCLTNNILRIDCHWSAPDLGPGSGSWLLFTSNQAPGSKHKCIFQGSACTLELPPEEVLLPSDNFTITLHRCVSGKEQVSLVDPQYLPRRHVKLDPPSDLHSNISSGSCVLTWTISPALEPMTTLLSYELALKRQEEAWEQARHKDRIVGVTWLILEAIELDPGSTYEARLRVRMAVLEDDVIEEERHEGQWSEWSQSVCFPSPQRGGLLVPSWGWLDSTFVAVPVFLLLTGLTYLLFKLSPRVKKTFHQNVPSPAVFFQPLYTVHNGNFQTWIGTHGASPQLTQDCVNTLQGASESSIWEAITLLTYGLARSRQSSSLEEQEGTGPGLSEALSSVSVQPAGCVELGEQSAYLPQEDWAFVSLTRPVPPDSQGRGSDYCALACYRGCQPSALSGNTQSTWPIPASACGPSCSQQGAESQQGDTCEGAGHGQRHGLQEELPSTLDMPQAQS